MSTAKELSLEPVNRLEQQANRCRKCQRQAFLKGCLTLQIKVARP
jgi:hypothetical protein